jgi:membrane protein implicated in regulation of membrane protease activity
VKSKANRQPKAFRDVEPSGRRLALIIRYALLQLPEAVCVVIGLILIDHWWPVPAWLFWSIISLWLVKDIALFPLLWRAYDWNHSDMASNLLGQQGAVVRRLDPAGYIRIRGELWRAEISSNARPIEKGSAVRVVDAEGLTLHVQPTDVASRPS